MPSRVRKRAAILAVLAALLATAPAGAATVRNYDLGETTLPDPGPKGPLPVRLWGAIGLPAGPGPHPLVVVTHGRHGDNCPPTAGESFEWPCFAREQRNDLGLRHVVAALARRGVAAISPDVNGAYTIGWGEPSDERRWPRIVKRTLAELANDVEGDGTRFGIALGDRIDLGTIGLLGHSRSGHNSVRIARALDGIDSLFLLAPVYDGAKLPDLVTAVIASRCDADVPGEARKYLDQARRQRRNRDRPLFFARLEGANHNYYNRTLSELGRDDGQFAGIVGCGRRQRLGAGAQQHWLDAIAADFFAASLDGAARPAWMRPRSRPPKRLYGLPVRYERVVPR